MGDDREQEYDRLRENAAEQERARQEKDQAYWNKIEQDERERTDSQRKSIRDNFYE